MNKLLITILLLPLSSSFAQTVVETVPVKVLTPTGSLATCAYMPSEQETPFYKELGKNEITTGSFMAPYKLQGKRNKFVSWYGIVRGIRDVPGKSDTHELLLEQKYFDGMSDCHIMLVSKSGAGDFIAQVTAKDATIPSLSMIRVYGKVVSETAGVPRIDAQFIRIWPWFTFTFTDLGAEDHSNPKWQKLCKICQSEGRIYKPYPTENYYLAILGDPSSFGTMLPADDWPK